ncbi:MAG TPA: alpha/beta fold hydrolase [Dehalococcoidia bacterium]
MPFVDRDGVKIYYEEAGSGPAIVLGHAYSSSGRMWDAFAEAFKGSYHVITYDLRGHDRSDSPEAASQYSEDATIGDIDAIMKACGVDTAVLGGLSLGGYMSLAYYHAHPELVRALILSSTGPGFRNPAARENWNQMAENIARGFEENGLAALGRGAEVRAAQQRSAQGLAHAARGMLAQFDARVIESLDQIEVPVLVLMGSRDQQYAASTDYMASKIPNVTKVVIDDAGHAANIHQPEAFNSAVRDFLIKSGI